MSGLGVSVWSFQFDGTRPIDNLVVVSFGVLHRLKHQLSIDRRHAPDDSLERRGDAASARSIQPKASEFFSCATAETVRIELSAEASARCMSLVFMVTLFHPST